MEIAWSIDSHCVNLMTEGNLYSSAKTTFSQCVCVCVCVCSDGSTLGPQFDLVRKWLKAGRQRGEKEPGSVCVCVCERERELDLSHLPSSL